MVLLDLPERIALASDITQQIKDDLERRWYSASDIEFSITWQQTLEVRATASVEPSLDRIDRHVVSLSYGLIDQIYSIAFEFARFSTGGPGRDMHAGVHMLPRQFDIMRATDLMFMAGIMFVVYHEVGHLNQNHGAIRAIYGTNAPSAIVDECEVAGEGVISGAQSAISHATEFAADYEALDWMAASLMPFVGVDFLDHAYLHCGIVSCIMLLFNGARPIQIDAEPMGTHPYPLPRMDHWVRLFAERTALISTQNQIAEDQIAIAQRLSDASFVALMSWLVRGGGMATPEYTAFCRGSQAHPNYAEYMGHVVNMWSRHDEQARSARRYGGALSVMYFSDEFRAMVGAGINRETYLSHIENTLATVRPQRS